jgi:hypothetical protein
MIALRIIMLLLLHAASPVVPADSSSGSSSGNHASVTYQQRADAVLGAFLPRLEKAGMAMPQMCAAAWLRSRVPLRQAGVRVWGCETLVRLRDDDGG